MVQHCGCLHSSQKLQYTLFVNKVVREHIDFFQIEGHSVANLLSVYSYLTAGALQEVRNRIIFLFDTFACKPKLTVDSLVLYHFMHTCKVHSKIINSKNELISQELETVVLRISRSHALSPLLVNL